MAQSTLKDELKDDPYATRPWLCHYDPGVAVELEVDDVPLTRLLLDTARRFPRKAALWSPLGALSYHQLLSEVQKFAAVLARLGVRAGDRVLVVMPNSLQQVIALYGTLWRGAVAVLTSLDFPPPVLTSHLVDSQASVAVVPTPLPDILQEALRASGPEHVLFSSGKEYTRSVRGLLKVAARVMRPRRGRRRYLRWRSLMRRASDGFPLEPVDPGTPAVIEYTGGTTGMPRGVVLTHRSLVANAAQLAAWDRKMGRGRDRILGAVPLAHSYGLTTCLNLSVRIGATLLLPQSLDPDVLLELCSRFRPTLFPGVPLLYGTLLSRPGLRGYGLSSIRACVSGAAPLPVEVQEGFEKVTRGRLVEGYGLTEASPVTHANPLYGERRAGSIGVPLPGTEARIVDPETGLNVPAGRVGELVVRGPQIMQGYWQNPDATEQVLRDGWLFTGDMAQMDPDGFFFLINRKSDVLHVSGRRVFPRDVEEVLYEHPAVLEAVVGGWPPGQTEVDGLRAYLRLHPGRDVSLEEIRTFCARRLPEHMVPAHLTVTDSLPRNPFGKVLRRALPELVQPS